MGVGESSAAASRAASAVDARQPTTSNMKPPLSAAQSQPSWLTNRHVPRTRDLRAPSMSIAQLRAPTRTSVRVVLAPPTSSSAAMRREQSATGGGCVDDDDADSGIALSSARSSPNNENLGAYNRAAHLEPPSLRHSDLDPAIWANASANYRQAASRAMQNAANSSWRSSECFGESRRVFASLRSACSRIIQVIFSFAR